MGAACGKGSSSSDVEPTIIGAGNANAGAARPELDAWVNDRATLLHWDDHMDDNMLTVGNHPKDQAEMRQLLDRVWRESTREVWAKFLGEGLLGAASEGNLESTKQLISAGANLRCRDRNRKTPLHRAAHAGHVDVVSYLLRADGKVAPSTGNDLGKSVDRRPVWQSNKWGQPLLTRTVSLIQNGRDNHGSIPLHLAAAGGRARVVDVLLRDGADPGAPNGIQQTPLHLAAMCSSGATGATIRLLIEAGADVMARDNAGRTPLHSAASEGTEEAISVLVGAGAKPEARGSIGRRTPLHEACARLRPKNVERLLDLGADECAVDSDGRTAGDRIGEWSTFEATEDPGVEDLIRRTLAGGPKGRTWRRRRLLMLLRSRQPAIAPENVPEGLSHGPLVAVVVSLQDDIFRSIVSYL